MVSLAYTPDLDCSWAVNPGALTNVGQLAPLQSGAYGSVAESNYFGSSTLTGTNILAAYAFRKVAGTVRFLVFREGDIDEYDSSATRTNRATGLTTATEWNAAAWGDQIIAVSLANSTQSSTGAGFSALAGAPKARHVAANQNFVMLADVDDGGSNVYKDMVWWSGLQNPATWTPNVATQAGNVRLLDAPGPITALVPFRDTFVAFKDNAVFIGEYVGPQGFIFNWRLVSARVGCIGSKAVTELDGKLYFFHPSGFWEFDGQALRNVGIPVIQSFLTQGSYITGSGSAGASPPSGTTPDSLTTVDAAADDIEGVVWFRAGFTVALSGDKTQSFWGYSPRSGKWGATGAGVGTATASASRLVRATTADMQAFLADTDGRLWYVLNSAGGTTVRSAAYPASMTGWVLTTGVLGTNDGSASALRVWPRMLKGASQAAISAGTMTGYTTEDQNVTNGSAALSPNTSFDCLDGILSSKFRAVTLTGGTDKKAIIGGLGIDLVGGGKR